MENRNDITQELKESAPALASLNRRMPYYVPVGYFEEFPLSVLGVLAPKATLSVPEGYFESLPAAILRKAKAQAQSAGDENDTGPFLNSISRKMPYTVPAHYFEELDITPRVRLAPVIPVGRSYRKIAGWAVAASFLALVSVFGYRFFSGTEEQGNSGIAGISMDSIATAELADALSDVPEDKLDAELDSYGFSGDHSALYYLNTVNFEKALQTISDDELKTTLETQVYTNKNS